MIPANGKGGIHALIGMIQSVQSPEVEPQPRRQPGITDADLANLSALAYQRQQAHDALTASQLAPDSTELYTAEVVAGANAAAVQRRQRPGSSLGINT